MPQRTCDGIITVNSIVRMQGARSCVHTAVLRQHYCKVIRLLANMSLTNRSLLPYCNMPCMMQEAWPRGFWRGIIQCCRLAALSLFTAASCLPTQTMALSVSTGTTVPQSAKHFAYDAHAIYSEKFLLQPILPQLCAEHKLHTVKKQEGTSAKWPLCSLAVLLVAKGCHSRNAKCMLAVVFVSMSLHQDSFIKLRRNQSI